MSVKSSPWFPASTHTSQSRCYSVPMTTISDGDAHEIGKTRVPISGPVDATSGGPASAELSIDPSLNHFSAVSCVSFRVSLIGAISLSVSTKSGEYQMELESLQRSRSKPFYNVQVLTRNSSCVLCDRRMEERSRPLKRHRSLRYRTWHAPETS